MHLHAWIITPARWNTEHAENWDFLRGVFPLRAGPEIFLTQETPENQCLQRERELARPALPAKHDPLTIVKFVERERELRERERAPRVQVHEPREVWGVDA